MINADDILQSLMEAERQRLEALEVFAELDSTNTYLLERPAPGARRFRVAIAEHQTHGRGRPGKSWVSPPSSGLCMSMSYTFAETPAYLPSLTLAIGVGVAAALQTIGVEDVALKWPNDVVARDGKLGGILTEVKSRSRGRTIVIGLGLNVDLPNKARAAAPDAWATKLADLKECVETLPSRSLLAAGMLQCVLASIERFEHDGFAAFHADWQAYDWLKGKAVSIPQPYGNVRGTANGLDSDGALLVETIDGTRRIVTGSVTVTDSMADGA